jgi:hypothetical protein
MDTVKLYTYQRSNKVVGALVLSRMSSQSIINKIKLEKIKSYIGQLLKIPPLVQPVTVKGI